MPSVGSPLKVLKPSLYLLMSAPLYTVGERPFDIWKVWEIEMATLIVPGAALVTIKGTCSGQDVVNVIGIQNTVGTPGNTVLAAVKTAWEKAGGPLKLHTTAFTMTGYEYVDLSTINGQTATLGSTTAGGIGSPLSTMASAALIQLQSATRNRTKRGRLYHGPLGESQINTDGRTLDPASLAALLAAYTTFRNDLSSATQDWAVVSRKTSTYSPIASIGVSGIVATQRRRLR